MQNFDWKEKILSFDARRDLIIPGNKEQTIDFCVTQLIALAHEAIKERGQFTLALSGGSTPNALYHKLSQTPYKDQIDWSRVWLFWSDERSVSADHIESNYHNSLTAGLDKLPIPQKQIFRMKAENEIEIEALNYEKIIKEKIPHGIFDVIMLGMGEDGHTASLFPETHGLQSKDRLVIANYIPQKETWRMTLTYECIHMARHTIIYVLGASKSEMVAKIFYSNFQPNLLPIQKIGTITHKALWILDDLASKKLMDERKKAQ